MFKGEGTATIRGKNRHSEESPIQVHVGYLSCKELLRPLPETLHQSLKLSSFDGY
jgi:hypothetical protein